MKPIRLLTLTMLLVGNCATASGLPQSCKNIAGSSYKIAKSMGGKEMEGINNPSELQAKMEKEWEHLSNAEQGKAEAECRQAEMAMKKLQR